MAGGLLDDVLEILFHTHSVELHDVHLGEADLAEVPVLRYGPFILLFEAFISCLIMFL